MGGAPLALTEGGDPMTTNEPLNIVLGSDTNNLLGLAVTVKSLLDTTASTCHFFILSMGLSDDDKNKLRESWRHPRTHAISFIDVVGDEISGLRPTMYIKNCSSYVRLVLDQKLPQTVNRCLWLDTDLLINSDIAELYTQEIEDNIIGAVLDISTKTLDDKMSRHLTQDLGLDDPRLYFNAGVLLIDLKKWRSEKIGENGLDFGRTHYDIVDAQDQDILNALLKGKWKRLDDKWNQSQYLPDLNEKQGIIHLIGQRKPWHPDYCYRFQQRFFNILDTTAFQGWRPLYLWGAGKYFKAIERITPSPEIFFNKIRRLCSRRPK